MQFVPYIWVFKNMKKINSQLRANLKIALYKISSLVQSDHPLLNDLDHSTKETDRRRDEPS